MTLFELVIRSMRKNIKQDYLYFFALIFSTGLYFIFSTLHHDPSITTKASANDDFAESFQIAEILLLLIVVAFMGYANRIFLNRRSREMALLQLAGMTKKGVARLLILENAILGAGALILGIGVGTLLSHLFLLILMKLIGYGGVLGMPFSAQAFVQTILVFAALILVTSVQMLVTVYRSTLLKLFNANKQGDHSPNTQPVVSATLAVLSILFIVFGCWLSGNRVSPSSTVNLVAFIASTIAGTYLLFRVTINRLLDQFRKSKDGHLGMKNSLSIAPLLHHLKTHATSLTLITVLSATTIAMVAISYSTYYTFENEVRSANPYDFIFENEQNDSESFRAELQSSGIAFQHHAIEAVRLAKEDSKSIADSIGMPIFPSSRLVIYPAEQLVEAGTDMAVPNNGEVVLYLPRNDEEFGHDALPFPMELKLENDDRLRITKRHDRVIMNNFQVNGLQLVASEATVRELGKNRESVHFDTYRMTEKHDLAKASDLYKKMVETDKAYGPGSMHRPDYYSLYEQEYQNAGLLIFVVGFLGVVLLLSTGSILYFKQMTEAEQEKKNYTILRQLGFDRKQIMRGIMRKQLFVFAIPLVLALLYSAVAVQATTIQLLSDITVPTVIAMTVYASIYFVFAILTVGYYKNVVKSAL